MMHAERGLCLWCTAAFTLRRGGSPKKFCSARCRHEFHSRARRWAEAAIAAGILTAADIRNGDPAACTLVLAAGSYGTVGEAPGRRSAPVAPSADGPSARQRAFERLLGRDNRSAAAVSSI